MDVIYNLIHEKRFFKYTLEEKVKLKQQGRPLPDISMKQSLGRSRGKVYARQFNRSVYSRNNWISGCNRKNALFCFPCVLFGGEKAWTETGITDLIHLSVKIKKHETSKHHLHNQIEFALLGTVNIKTQLESAYWVNIQNFNEKVSKNRYVLSKIIDCVKFCGIFKLALIGNDETETSDNPGIFRGLLNFRAELDSALAEHLKNSRDFKETSKDVNDILDCILVVCQEEIRQQISRASYVAVMIDEITGVSSKSQLAVIFRYCQNGEPVERFWTFLQTSKHNEETLTENILSVLNPVLENSSHKLIAQSYDGRHTGVQTRILEKYEFAHFIYCCANQLDSFIPKAASFSSQIRLFFGNVQEVRTFFSSSPEYISVLNNIVRRRITHGLPKNGTFNVCTINVLFEHKESIIECMQEIEETFDNPSVCSSASSIRRMFQDKNFIFWLTFFHHVMPHVEVLVKELQKVKTDPIRIQEKISGFKTSIILISNSIDDIIQEASGASINVLPPLKRIRFDNSEADQHIAAIEVLDDIKGECVHNGETECLIEVCDEVKRELFDISEADYHSGASKVCDRTKIENVDNSETNYYITAKDVCDGTKRKHIDSIETDYRITATEVCDSIINYIQNHFHFSGHVILASLFEAQHFGKYSGKFPSEKVDCICSAYPNLDKERLQTELAVIYSRQDCRNISGAVPFLKFLIENNLSSAFSETKKVLEILITTPMLTAEAERCFSTLKRIKMFLRNTMTQDRLDALAMLSVERKLVSEILNFNEKVIDKFAEKRSGSVDLIYKKIS